VFRVYDILESTAVYNMASKDTQGEEKLGSWNYITLNITLAIHYSSA
jgi:hypothetical protein